MRFLYVQLGLTEDQMKKKDLLPKEEQKTGSTEPRSLWQKVGKLLRGLLGRKKESGNLPQTKNQQQPPEG